MQTKKPIETRSERHGSDVRWWTDEDGDVVLRISYRIGEIVYLSPGDVMAMFTEMNDGADPE